MHRSIMFVPAKGKTLLKIPSLNADCFIIDLEDSIEPDEKSIALERTCRFLESYSSEKKVYIRLNGKHFLHEMNMLSRFQNIGFMLPKFESICQYSSGESIWNTHEVVALIETPYGLINIREIVSCEWIDALAFGAEDYTATVNMTNRHDLLYYQKSLLISYAKAYRKMVFDTPSFAITDEAAFQSEVDSAVSLGFDGKLLIHPKHISYINKAFGEVDLEYIKQVVNEYEMSGKAVAVINGRVYEKMHITRMKKILKECEE
jgi:citrate lyase subunit beta/citryl-CoA lyase